MYDTLHNRYEFINEGETVYITEDLSGAECITAYTRCDTTPHNWCSRMLHAIVGQFCRSKFRHTFSTVVGRKEIVSDGYIRSEPIIKTIQPTLWQKYWHDKIAKGLKEGEACFYVIVGYDVDEDRLTPYNLSTDGHATALYGSNVALSYGCTQGVDDIPNQAYIYRINRTDEQGSVYEYPTATLRQRCMELGIPFVPVLDKFQFTTMEDMIQRRSTCRHGVTCTVVGKIEPAPVLKDEAGQDYILDPVTRNRLFFYKKDQVFTHGIQLFYIDHGTIYYKIHDGCEEKVNQLSNCTSMKVGDNLYVTSAKNGLPGDIGTGAILTIAPIHPRIGIVVRYDDRKEFMVQEFRTE